MNRQKTAKILHWLVGSNLMMSTLVYAANDQQSYDYLKNLDMEKLMEVEVTLDEVFDIFDGLIKAQKVTVATGTEQSTTRAPAVTTVMTSQDIEAMGATDLDEVLETVPGLHVARSARIYTPIYTIRGVYTLNNPEVLMLLNGIPMTSVYLGDRGHPWAGMPIHMISRIEIIRGPGSAIYGADAFAGVINIITKTKEDIQGVELGTRLDRFSTYEGWMLHGGTWHGFDIAASLEYRTTDGPKNIITADAQTQYDKVYKTHASLAPGSVNLNKKSLDMHVDIKRGPWQARVGYQGRYDVGTGVGVGQALSPEGYFIDKRTFADLTYQFPALATHWDVTTQMSYLNSGYQTFENRLLPRGAFGGAYPDGYIGNPSVSERHVRWDTFAFYSGFKKHLVRLGTGYQNNDQYKVSLLANYGIHPTTGLPLPPGGPVISFTDTPYNFNKKAKRNSWYLSLQDVWTITNEWELTGGIRYDEYSDFGGTTNPRMALVWQPHQSFTTKLMYGRAFRAPSFAELHNINNPVSLGNPNLKPETVDTWEWAFDYYATQNLHLAANLFRYDMNDKIATVPSPNGKTRSFQNVGHWKGQGLEMEIRWKTSKKSSLLANYSYAKATDEANGSDIGNYPQHSAYLRTDWLLKINWYLNVQMNWIADRHRTLGDPRPEISDYTTVDLALRYKDLREGRMNIALGIRNLFNADAREPSQRPDARGIVSIPDDLPLAERNWFMEFRYQF